MDGHDKMDYEERLTMRTFMLIRVIPGPTPFTQATGIVADAVVFPDGLAVLHWRGQGKGRMRAEIYESEEDMRDVRERSGRSHFEEDGVAP
jgi:hypothetical protein